ncbi:nicotinate-nucleotide--dimethylbenzimidazole phosphoribosyltransferase [Streptomyces mexicanus]|uniref:nicotinate-nucleotide--dimethylbenzimidazole phosphoribosyltransferase n=1 Tax=Streptomyces mexicanus TaxID=178566 RepID=UPI00364CB966
MTDTGQVPGEGLPESAGMVEQPGVPAHGAYTYLSESPAEDEDLLLPGHQGAWGHEVPPPAPEPVVEAVHEPGPHETAGRDSGSVDLSGVLHPDPAATAHATAPAAPPRRPLHLGPPIPDTSASPVRSLADRGPANAPFRQSGPPTTGPEYLDVPQRETAPQGAAPQGAAPWGAQAVAAPAAAPAVGAQATTAETVVPGGAEAAEAGVEGAEASQADAQAAVAGVPGAAGASGGAVAGGPVPGVVQADAVPVAAEEAGAVPAADEQGGGEPVGPAQAAVARLAAEAGAAYGPEAAQGPQAQAGAAAPDGQASQDGPLAADAEAGQPAANGPATGSDSRPEGVDALTAGPADGSGQVPEGGAGPADAGEVAEAAPGQADDAAQASEAVASPVAEGQAPQGVAPAAAGVGQVPDGAPVFADAQAGQQEPAPEAGQVPQDARTQGAEQAAEGVSAPETDQDTEGVPTPVAGQAPEGVAASEADRGTEGGEAPVAGHVPQTAHSPADAPAPEGTPAPEGAPAAEGTPVPEGAAPAALPPEGAPAPEGVPVPEGAAPEGAPVPDGVPAPEGTPVPETASAPEAAPDPAGAAAPEGAHAPDTTPTAPADPATAHAAVVTPDQAPAVEQPPAPQPADAVPPQQAAPDQAGQEQAQHEVPGPAHVQAGPDAQVQAQAQSVQGPQDAAPLASPAEGGPQPAVAPVPPQAAEAADSSVPGPDAVPAADASPSQPADTPAASPAPEPVGAQAGAPAPEAVEASEGTRPADAQAAAAQAVEAPAPEQTPADAVPAQVPAADGVPQAPGHGEQSAAAPLPGSVPTQPQPGLTLGQFVPVEGSVPTTPHLAPTPPQPFVVPAHATAAQDEGAVPAPREGDAVAARPGDGPGPEAAQNADDLDTRVADQEEPQEESTAAVAPARQSTGPAAPGYDEAEREAVLKVMRERRDIRNGFRSDPIPHEVLLRVLEAAHTAPSVGHSQPWDFVVIRSAETRQAMHELAMRQRDAYAKSLPKGRAKQFKELKIEAILDTPVNIVVTADPTRGGRHTLGRHTQPQMAPYSAALAVENLWLAARAEGLGVGWVSFFDEREMVRALGLPEHLEVIAYLCVGYVDEFPDEPELMQAGWSKRRPLSWVVHEETYGRRALPGEEPHDLLAETVAQIRPLDAKALGEAWERQKRMTKPAGALGMLEIISAQLCGLSRQCPPPIPEPAAVAIFAGDHGVHAQGVTPWPQEVTGQMVANFLGGGAVCNAFASQVGAEVCVVDVGVAADLPATPGLLPRKIRGGTSDMTAGCAMTREEAKQAIEVGIETARDLVAAGNKALLTGEMGIANTTASAALISVYTGADPAEVTGRGTGINDETLARKTEVVRRALELHQPDPADPIGVLAAVGGFEHAAMVGLLLGGASLRTPVILDGVSAGAAALVARAIAPEVLAACIAGHRSAEPGHVAALNKLGLRPLVDLDLRLGEGTGALLALPLVQSTARAMHEVATFDSAGVTEK